MSTFWTRYDKLPEPKRFLAFFIPAVILLAGCSAGSYGLALICWGLLAFMLVSRMMYLMRGF